MKRVRQVIGVVAAGIFSLPTLSSCTNYQQQATDETAAAVAEYQRKPRLPEPSGIEVATINITTTVQAVDRKRRTVTLIAPDGSPRSYKCGAGVVNFDQIKPGDQVSVTLLESVAFDVSRVGEPGITDVAKVALAHKGARPGVVLADTLQITATVNEVDPVNHIIALTGMFGHTRLFRVNPLVDLSAIRQGDEVTVRYTEDVAVLVEQPQAANLPLEKDN
jgi:hypothetical protein